MCIPFRYSKQQQPKNRIKTNMIVYNTYIYYPYDISIFQNFHLGAFTSEVANFEPDRHRGKW